MPLFSFSLPNSRQNEAFVAAQDRLLSQYQPLSGTQLSEKIIGFDNDYQRVAIGNGAQQFEIAKQAIRDWKMFPADWTRILPHSSPIRTSQTVAMYARFLGLWWRNSCRIVYTVDEKSRFGFAYGTLPAHVELGEELFLVEIDEAGTIWYTIKAFSRPRFWMARVGYPMMRFLQEKFRRDSAQSMLRAIQQTSHA